jgi:hypothetical protein
MWQPALARGQSAAFYTCGIRNSQRRRPDPDPGARTEPVH